MLFIFTMKNMKGLKIFFSFPRAAWERIQDALRPITLQPQLSTATRGAARRYCIPTQRVGTRKHYYESKPYWLMRNIVIP
jgi:hypothetical protein